MSVKEALHSLVDRLDEVEAIEALGYLTHLVDGDGVAGLTTAEANQREAPPMMSGAASRRQPSIDWRALAAQQGTGPITDLDQLVGDFWPEDETVDELIAAVRAWRREGGRG
jgi:hypothetical protein